MSAGKHLPASALRAQAGRFLSARQPADNQIIIFHCLSACCCAASAEPSWADRPVCFVFSLSLARRFWRALIDPRKGAALAYELARSSGQVGGLESSQLGSSGNSSSRASLVTHLMASRRMLAHPSLSLGRLLSAVSVLPFPRGSSSPPMAMA